MITENGFPAPLPAYPKGAIEKSFTACFSFNALQAMRIMQDVQMKLAGNENVIALGVKNSKLPYVKQIGELKMMIEDNPDAMEFMIGVRLCNEIINFK